MQLPEKKQGDLLVLAQSLLSALFPIATVASYKNLTPLVSLMYSSVFTALVFIIIYLFRPQWEEFKKPGVIKELFLVSLLIGVGFYGLYFFGLSKTSPGNASIIALMEIFFSYLFFHVWRKEEMDFRHIVGGLLMVLGAATVLFNKATEFKIGDLFVLVATTLPPLGNYFQQKLRKRVSTNTILIGRSVLTLPFLLLLCLLLREDLSWQTAKGSLWFLVINGAVFLGFTKILWLEGIHRISVTKANIISSISPVLTIFFAAAFLKQMPTFWQLFSFVPMALGLWMLIGQKPAAEAEMENV